MKSKSRSAKEICCEIEALCETACEPESQKALDKYHKGSVHATILISTGFSDRMQTEIRRIRSGKPSPYPFFICCEGCFALLLTESLEHSYPALGCDHEPDDPFWTTVDPSRAPKDPKRLKRFLLRHGCSWNTTRRVPNWEDVKYREFYLQTLRTLFESGARLAKGLGNEGVATELVEALRLTYPKPHDEGLIEPRAAKAAAVMTREQEGRLYETGTRGLAHLWDACQLAELDPIRPKPRKRTSGKNG